MTTILSLSFLFLLPTAQSHEKGMPQCVASDDPQGRYLCTNDPQQVVTRRASHYRGGELSIVSEEEYGVPQRMDGSIAERTAVDDVMEQMRDYFLQEVLSKPEYISVRGKCINSNELCAFWTSVGECDSNRSFMLNNCAAACRLCLLLQTTLQ